MKLKKIIGRLVSYFDADVKTQRKEKKALHKLLKELKRKEKNLCDELTATQSIEKREELQTKLEVVRAQRTKGMGYLQAERKKRKDKLDSPVETTLAEPVKVESDTSAPDKAEGTNKGAQ